jgi:broad specificity phosphatase PhoE
VNISGIPVEVIMRKHEKSLRMASKGDRRIYLVRHGAVLHHGNIKRYIGWTDLPLSEDGIRQAGALGQRLQDTPLVAVCCSDLRRSFETARIIGKFHGLEPRATSSFQEVGLGEWEGVPFDGVRLLYPAEYEEGGGPRKFSPRPGERVSGTVPPGFCPHCTGRFARRVEI